MQTIQQESLNLSVGEVSQGSRDLLVRTLGEFNNLREIEEIIFSLPQGGSVRLEDFAQVKDTYEKETIINKMDGERSIGILVYKQSDANTVQVADDIHGELETLRKELADAEIKTALDGSEFIKSSIKTLAQTASVGALMAIIVLYFFLRSWRSTLIIGLAIPLAVVSTFNLQCHSGSREYLQAQEAR
ncbi:multidrug efflux pump subunit AcrB [Desulfitispora alkaliphila]